MEIFQNSLVSGADNFMNGPSGSLLAMTKLYFVRLESERLDMKVACATSGNPLTVFQATALYRKQTASGNTFTHKEVSDNIAFSDQERLSSENRSCRFIAPDSG